MTKRSSITPPRTTAEHVQGVLTGDRAALARAITLIESEHQKHAELAQDVLTELLPHTGKARRVGISGVPGAGKSTFIDSLGMYLLESDKRVAVLAIDPSSAVSGGSILGDKTRMARLARDERAFIRPSPASGTLGGVARKTRETMLLCEAAGFDVVLVETVGVGQSEIVVAGMVDFFLVLMIAGAGDELQGIKRGILEVADMLAINKADGDNLIRAERAAREYAMALHLMRSRERWKPPVLTCSALENRGMEEIWAKIEEHRAQAESHGELATRRQQQQIDWMWAMIRDGVMARLQHHPTVRAKLTQLEKDVSSGSTTPTRAAAMILEAFLGTTAGKH